MINTAKVYDAHQQLSAAFSFWRTEAVEELDDFVMFMYASHGLVYLARERGWRKWSAGANSLMLDSTLRTVAEEHYNLNAQKDVFVCLKNHSNQQAVKAIMVQCGKELLNHIMVRQSLNTWYQTYYSARRCSELVHFAQSLGTHNIVKAIFHSWQNKLSRKQPPQAGNSAANSTSLPATVSPSSHTKKLYVTDLN